MGRSGNPVANSERRTVENELAELKMSAEAEADLVCSIVLSVLRDIGLGGHYGMVSYNESGTYVTPKLDTIFQPSYAEAVAAEVTSLSVVKTPDVLLWTGWGDMIGNLSRLLVAARELPTLKPLVEAANVKISGLELDVTYMSDSDFLRHLRNAVAHARFGVQVNPADPFASRVVFLDLAQRDSKVTAKISLTAEQLARVMRIVIEEVFDKYLQDVGWTVE